MIIHRCEIEWFPLQIKHLSRRLLLRRPSYPWPNQQHFWLTSYRRQCPKNPRPQHPRCSLSRIDYAAGGLNPPHTHPRATEIVFVLEGTLDVGFITTANLLFSKSLKKGDVFVFPKGLVHFQKNNGKGPASVIAAFNSQLPGTQSLGATLFAATPAVPDDVLTKAFQIGTKEVKKIKDRFAPKK
ncbi:hypothetical protein QQ045_025304 [Rhodiola kirilowii]